MDTLETLLDYRESAIGPGDETEIAAVEALGGIAATKKSYQRYRQALNALAGIMDEVVGDRLGQVLGTG